MIRTFLLERKDKDIDFLTKISGKEKTPKEMKGNRKNNQGIAMITLIFFVLIATIYISAAVIIIGINSLSATTTAISFETSRLSESALEDALLRILRDPTYTGGTFNLEGGSVTVNVTGTTTKDIAVSVVNDNYLRKYQAQIQFVGAEMQILSWKEVF